MKRQHSAFALLALAPLLGATDLLVKAIVIGLLGLLTLTLCNLLLAPLRRWLHGTALLLASLLLGGLLLSTAELLLQMLSTELAAALALFLPLLVLPCLGLALEPRPSALRPGLLFAILAIALGLLREGLGNATLLSHADWLFGPGASAWQLAFAHPAGIHLLTLAPGAFILLGLLLAAARHFHFDERP
ncbi:MAG TPA: Rnf-Nqr domain containing protein [Pseudomonas sp.]|nr:Rnf-Nqr domain containing protein [Pseudomonas sp.]